MWQTKIVIWYDTYVLLAVLKQICFTENSDSYLCFDVIYSDNKLTGCYIVAGFEHDSGVSK